MNRSCDAAPAASCRQEALDEIDLETMGQAWDRGRVSLRWVSIHMLEEDARHAGHLDIIRELIDGTTGDHDRPAD